MLRAILALGDIPSFAALAKKLREKCFRYFLTASVVSTLSFSAQIVSADAFSAAQRELEAVMETCYPDIDAESQIVPEFSIDGVFSTISIGLNDKTNAYVINPQYLVYGDKNARLCGTRGCDISIFAGEHRFVYTGWQPEEIIYENNNLILLVQSSWACGMLINASRCFSILSWDDVVNNFVHHHGNLQ